MSDNMKQTAMIVIGVVMIVLICFGSISLYYDRKNAFRATRPVYNVTYSCESLPQIVEASTEVPSE